MADDLTLKTPFLIIFRGAGVPIIYKFPLAPQDVRVSHPARLQIHQTLDDNFLDDFSGSRAVLSRVQLKGTFGYSKRGGGIGIPMSGAAHLRTIEALYETFNALNRQLKSTLRAVQEYANPGRLYFWRIAIDRLEISQSSRDPLLFYYSLSFARLQDYLSPGGPRLPVGTLPGSSSILGDFGQLASRAGGLFG